MLRLIFWMILVWGWFVPFSHPMEKDEEDLSYDVSFESRSRLLTKIIHGLHLEQNHLPALHTLLETLSQTHPDWSDKIDPVAKNYLRF